MISPGFEHPLGPQVGGGSSALMVGGNEMVDRNSATANQSKHFFTM